MIMDYHIGDDCHSAPYSLGSTDVNDGAEKCSIKRRASWTSMGFRVDIRMKRDISFGDSSMVMRMERILRRLWLDSDDFALGRGRYAPNLMILRPAR